jgi:branched-chain amino acid transport system permease protein
MVVSIGLALFLQYMILWAFGGAPRPYDDHAVQRPMDLFQPINVEPKSLWIITIAVVVLGAVGLIILKTRIGTAMRAVSDNADLARSSGIDVDRVIAATWVIGAALAALGGVMFGLSENVQWQMGTRLLLAIFAAVVLGGLGTAFGAMVGAFVIGFAIEVCTIVVPTELKFAVALAALIGMLLVRPQGLLGKRSRIG